MLTKGIEAVLLRAISDTAFADALFEDAEKALAEYNLTAEDIAKFKGLFSKDSNDTQSAASGSRKSFDNMVPNRQPGNQGWTNHNEIALKA